MNHMAQRDPEGGDIRAGQVEMHELQPKWMKTDRFSDGLEILTYSCLWEDSMFDTDEDIGRYQPEVVVLDIIGEKLAHIETREVLEFFWSKLSL